MLDIIAYTILRYAPVVQWIERGPPKLQIQVRLLAGAPAYAKASAGKPLMKYLL